MLNPLFLHGNLQKEIYMEQAPGYVQNDSNLIRHLKKYLCGVKEAPWAWYSKMDNNLLDTDFSRCHSKLNVYTEKIGIHLIILILYVDDLILTGSDPKRLNHVKYILKTIFKMEKLGYFHYFLGLQVLQNKEEIFISQSKYAFFATFTWKILNQSLVPSSLESNLFPLLLLLKLMPLCTII